MKPISCTILFLWLCTRTPAQTTTDSSKKNWSESAAAYNYFIPGQKVPPTIIATADHAALHLETRYNYEDINSVSFFAGWAFEKQFGELDVTATPMAGLVTGRTNGVLPGFEFNADYKTFNLYSENEYMLNFKGRNNYFFYSWTELNAQIFKNTKAGVLAQSLRWFKTKFDIQHGLYAEYSTGIFTFNAYYFNPFTSSHFLVIALNVAF